MNLVIKVFLTFGILMMTLQLQAVELIGDEKTQQEYCKVSAQFEQSYDSLVTLYIALKKKMTDGEKLKILEILTDARTVKYFQETDEIRGVNLARSTESRNLSITEINSLISLIDSKYIAGRPDNLVVFRIAQEGQTVNKNICK